MPPGDSPRPEQGLYLYAIAPAKEAVALGPIGLEGNPVFTIPYQGLCAIVHRCPAQPYQSGDPGVVGGWVGAHHRVVELAWERWGVVLPAGFDLILRGEGDSPEATLRGWLGREYDRLGARLEQLRGKAEYGLQVFYEPGAIAQELLAYPPLLALQEEIRASSPGRAYLLQERFKEALGKELEGLARRYFQEFYSQIKPWATELRVEKVKPAPPPYVMMMNLSCLVALGEAEGLGQVVAGIRGKQGFDARYTGPLPPYSFTGPG